MNPCQSLTAIIPCSNLDLSEAFYSRLGLIRWDNGATTLMEENNYRILHDGNGGSLHLRKAEHGWLIAGKNPFALYYYSADVDELAAIFRNEIIGKVDPEIKPWGMYEFAISDPDATLIRIGRPALLWRQQPEKNSCNRSDTIFAGQSVG
jgi:hypothetical protein